MWEKIDEYSERLAVPGGWIVRSWNMDFSMHQIFITDASHTCILIKEA